MARCLLLLMITCLTTVRANAQWPGQTPPSEVPVFVPTDYDPAQSMPLLIFLHGYSPLTTAWYDILLPLQEDANDRGYIFAKPDGSQDGLGEFYWNATEACCDMWGNDPDHVGYLLALVDSIEANYNIDPGRIHIVGHSNGRGIEPRDQRARETACSVSVRVSDDAYYLYSRFWSTGCSSSTAGLSCRGRVSIAGG
jgi:pimeloyl-ACP methyl ester carboxylesterase